MDDDEIQSSTSMLPIAIAVLAVALGGAGLYFGLSANQRINPMDASIRAGTTSVADMEDKISSLSARIEELAIQSDELTKTVNRVKAYGNQSEQAIKQLAGELNTNRKQIVKTAEKLNELAANGFRPAASSASTPATTTTSTQSSTTAQPESASSGGVRVYTIEAGDYFSKIATKTGVSLQALIDANPGVDSRRLQIGQQINIPAN
ncbi:MAG: LysM peptidoglycan-binding domain-containing protein [Verrucomicrobiota bacterium]